MKVVNTFLPTWHEYVAPVMHAWAPSNIFKCSAYDTLPYHYMEIKYHSIQYHPISISIELQITASILSCTAEGVCTVLLLNAVGGVNAGEAIASQLFDLLGFEAAEDITQLVEQRCVVSCQLSVG